MTQMGCFTTMGIIICIFNIIQMVMFGGQCIGGMPLVPIWLLGKNNQLLFIQMKIGYIFSGSAVVDVNNSSGFGSNRNKIPVVAMFTYHDMDGEKAGKNGLPITSHCLFV